MSIKINQFDIFKNLDSNTYQLRTKDDIFIIEFDDKEQENIFIDIVSYAKNEKTNSISYLKTQLDLKYCPTKVLEVLNILDSYSLFESNLNSDVVEGNYKAKQLCIFGNGASTEIINKTALKNGFLSHVYSYQSILTENEFSNIIEHADFLVVNADEWSPFHIELINTLALKYNKPWIYIGGIDSETFKIGPLFYGKETGCYNCLINRFKNNYKHPDYLISYEKHLKDNKVSAKPNIISSSLYLLHDLIANLTILEIINFYENWSIPPIYRCLIEINYLTLDIKKHELFKKPYCESCKPHIQYNSAPWLETIIPDYE